MVLLLVNVLNTNFVNLKMKMQNMSIYWTRVSFHRLVVGQSCFITLLSTLLSKTVPFYMCILKLHNRLSLSVSILCIVKKKKKINDIFKNTYVILGITVNSYKLYFFIFYFSSQPSKGELILVFYPFFFHLQPNT